MVLYCSVRSRCLFDKMGSPKKGNHVIVSSSLKREPATYGFTLFLCITVKYPKIEVQFFILNS